MKCNDNQNENFKIVAKNNKAYFNYEIIDKYEAGIMLCGPEVKSIRNSKVSLLESFIGPMVNSPHLYLFNANIAKYKEATYNNHEPKRPRILLLHNSQKVKLINAIQQKGMTVVPLTMYFNHKGLLKLSIALARGKNTVDKRNTIKKREWQIEKARLLKRY